jgi:hypothetical protein
MPTPKTDLLPGTLDLLVNWQRVSAAIAWAIKVTS